MLVVAFAQAHGVHRERTKYNENTTKLGYEETNHGRALAIAAMQADIKAMEQLEKWRITMKLDEESTLYKKYQKALLMDSQKRLTKRSGARSKAKEKSPRLKYG